MLKFKSLGEGCRISPLASIYGAERITIGNYVRIDDFCVISAGEEGIKIGDHIHIACFSSIIGKGRVELEDFVNISSRVSIYSSSDDFSGNSITGPQIPGKYKTVDTRNVTLRKHVIIGCGSVILPGVEIGEGTAVGALSLVKTSLPPDIIAAGTPAKVIKARSSIYKGLEAAFLDEHRNKSPFPVEPQSTREPK